MKAAIEAQARSLGFDDVGFAQATGPDQWGRNLAQWIDQGRHGQMDWMAVHQDRRANPQGLWPQAKSVVVLALSYAPKVVGHASTDHGVISVYAQGQDYHDLVKSKLKALARWMVGRFGGDVKVFVDTAPVMEKPIAATTAVGWQGRHTNLVSRRLGNWFFLGEIYTTLDVPADDPQPDLCGTCRACEQACPTQALENGRMDARRCISYLTIEHKGEIDAALRPQMGNRIYGCDACLAACPWNKFATPHSHAALRPRAELLAPPLADLAQLDDAAFRQVFRGSPIKRTGRDRFVRNVLIAIANSGNPVLIPVAEKLLADPAEEVRQMAAWAVERLTSEQPRGDNSPLGGLGSADLRSGSSNPKIDFPAPKA